MSPAEAASALCKAFNAEGDRLHADASLWPRATADALLQGRHYAERVRRFLGVGAVVEARQSYDAIAWQALHAVFDGNADLAVAAAVLREFLLDETVP
jgi:hypothetical protein